MRGIVVAAVAVVAAVVPMGIAEAASKPTVACRQVVSAADQYKTLLNDLAHAEVAADDARNTQNSDALNVAADRINEVATRFHALNTRYAKARKVCLAGR